MPDVVTIPDELLAPLTDFLGALQTRSQAGAAQQQAHQAASRANDQATASDALFADSDKRVGDTLKALREAEDKLLGAQTLSDGLEQAVASHGAIKDWPWARIIQVLIEVIQVVGRSAGARADEGGEKAPAKGKAKKA
jgi:hypothetical protein